MSVYVSVLVPHITVVTLSIESFAFRSVRIDVPMTQQQHDDCVTNPVCSMAVSQTCHSMLSGRFGKQT